MTRYDDFNNIITGGIYNHGIRQMREIIENADKSMLNTENRKKFGIEPCKI